MQSQRGAVLRDEALRLALDQGRPVVVPIVAGDASMEPLLRGGDEVLAAPLPRGLRRGDLIVFRQQDYLVVHRYLGPALSPDGTRCLRTRGDGRNVLDPPVRPDDLRARVAAVRRHGSWRSLDGALASVFARAVAWHALAWSSAGVAARPLGLGGAVAALDRALLRVGVPATFPWMHRRKAGPLGDLSAKTG